MTARADFNATIARAVADITERGFQSADQVAFWIEEIRKAAVATLAPEHVLQEALNRVFGVTYARLIDRGGIIKRHPGMPRFERVKPALRAELNRRILASAGLIKLNRRSAIEKTLQRFAGWTTSVPAGGSKVQDRTAVKANIGKALRSLPYEERRVIIDQGHKFSAELSNILARDGGALAGIWHSNWRQAGYDYREDHRERDLQVYAIRGNWALTAGLMKPGPAGYSDQVTKPAEEPFCRCFSQYVYTLADLPASMITAKGREALLRRAA